MKIILRALHQQVMQPVKYQQIAASMCLAKFIQNSPSKGIKQIIPKLQNRFLEQLSAPTTKCKANVLESVISLVLQIEKEFDPYAQNFLPYLLECASDKDAQTKKMAIDVIYTFGAILPRALAPYKD